MLRGAPSIRLIVALFMVAPVIAIATVLVILSSLTAHRVAEDLGALLVDRANIKVQDSVKKYLGSAVRTSDLYAMRVARGELPTSSLQSWERDLFDDLVTTPDVASICFGNIDGDATWLLRRNGRLELGRSEGQHDQFTQEFNVDAVTADIDLRHPLRTYTYDPRVRPWYQAATASDGPVWTPIYFWFGNTGADAETGSGYARVIHDPDTQQVRGVLVIDVTLGAMSGFLRSLTLSQYGNVFITDESNSIVASSHGPVNSSKGERLQLVESELAAAKVAAATLQKRAGQSDFSERVEIHGEPCRLQSRNFQPYPGLNWRIITTIPERVFLTEAQRTQQRSILLALVAIMLAIGLALAFSRWLCRPILAIRGHARRIGQGDFESRLDVRSAQELHDLSDDLNHMAVDLKSHVELRQALILANEVQQTLLPQAPPRVAGLDMVGYSQYCNLAGGDYYDFIDLAELPGKQTLVAVGDVMGHGVASALLMATARAALRATALREGSLGVLLTRVNSVLVTNARHNRFMTMLLAVVDPATGHMRWASAGHDPPFIYSPVRDEFRELVGGDVPLGIVEAVQYEEMLAVDIEPGSIIVIGTDGIWEARNRNHEHFGKARLCALIRQHCKETAEEIGQRISKALAEFSPQPSLDDVTFVVMKLWLYG